LFVFTKSYAMTQPIQQTTNAPPLAVGQKMDPTAGVVRIKSEDLFGQQREVEIDHQGRIYRLRLTQLNKLILTA
jgi:hemin uptake protein HemP